MPSTTVAVAHYPEGAGHATRMLAIAEALDSSGAEVLMAGGGAGTEFVSLNGYDEFEPTTVDYIDSYQSGSLRRVLTRSVPASASRVAEYVGWLRERDPDALVTDDMFAAMAAARTDVPLYALKHDLPDLYRDPVERAGARFHTSFQLSVSRAFFYPAVWPASDADPEGATRVPPVALTGDGREVDAPDVVVVPSHYSDLDGIADRLDARGRDVLHVGDDGWEPVTSLLPYIRAADAVVCSGYSTVMDAAVAGTPCVLRPATDEQAAVADRIEAADVPGFAVAADDRAALDAVASPPPPPDYDNGAATVASAVLEDLERAASSEPRSRTRALAASARAGLVDRAGSAVASSVGALLLSAAAAWRAIASAGSGGS